MNFIYRKEINAFQDIALKNNSDAHALKAAHNWSVPKCTYTRKHLQLPVAMFNFIFNLAFHFLSLQLIASGLLRPSQLQHKTQMQFLSLNGKD